MGFDGLDAERQSAGDFGRADALLVAFATRRAIDRGVPLGYLETLLADRFGAQNPRAVAAIITASREPVTLDQLIADYEGLRGALRSGAPDESLWQGFKRELGSLVAVRRSSVTATRLAQPLALEADRTTVAGAMLYDVAATVRDDLVAWKAGTVVAGPAKAIAASGSASRAGVRWQADRIEVAGATLDKPSGTIARDRTIAWRAEAARWRELSIEAPTGRVVGDALAVAAPRGRYRRFRRTREWLHRSRRPHSG